MLEIDDDVCFCDCGLMGDKTTVTNDRNVDINLMVKKRQFQHIKFTVSQILFKTFNEKVENKKLLAKKMFKAKVLYTYNKEHKYVINMEYAPESTTSN